MKLKSKFKSLIHLLDYFKNEKICIEYYQRKRWGKYVKCPYCNKAFPYKTNRGFKCSNAKCYKKFTVRTGTIFEYSKLPLRTWFAAIYLVSSYKKGISSVKLGIDLGVNQRTAWMIRYKINKIPHATFVNTLRKSLISKYRSDKMLHKNVLKY